MPVSRRAAAVSARVATVLCLLGPGLAPDSAPAVEPASLAVQSPPAAPGQPLAIAVQLTNPVPVRAVQVRLQADPSVLTLIGARITPRSHALSVDSQQAADGSITAVLISLGSGTIAPGFGAVMAIDVTVAGAAIPDEVVLNGLDVGVADAGGDALAAAFQSGRIAAAVCPGDCDRTGIVSIDELIRGVRIGLGDLAVGECLSLDANGDGAARIDELVAAVGNALDGCPRAATCGNGAVERGEQCDDGNSFGGDGCAANCTRERALDVELDRELSQAVVQAQRTRLQLEVRGRWSIRLGESRPDDAFNAAGEVVVAGGQLPAVMRSASAVFAPMQVHGVGCLCLRAQEAAELGPGNVASGVVACGAAPAWSGANLSIDHTTNDVDPACSRGSADAIDPTVCNGPPAVVYAAQSAAGAVALQTAVSVTLIRDLGTCSVDTSNPAKGLDGAPCTADDPEQGQAILVPLTTETAGARILDANAEAGVNIQPGAQCGSAPCETVATGHALDCTAFAAGDANPFAGALLAHATAVLNLPVLGDAVLTTVVTGECQDCVCGGPLATQCPPRRFCELPVGTCSPAAQGSCADRPLDCPPEVMVPVCGCDGVTYASDCLRAQAGVAEKNEGACSGSAAP